MGAVAINGTLISREGESPMLAVSAMDGDRLLSAALLDTAQIRPGETLRLPPLRVPARLDSIIISTVVR